MYYTYFIFTDTSIITFFGRITALRGTRNLAVYCMLSRLLRSVRLWRMSQYLASPID
jgi:hypothetical protein